MRKPIWAISTLVAPGMILATPAAAEENHTSCKAVTTVLVPIARSGGGGAVISPIARTGDAAELNAALRDATASPSPRRHWRGLGPAVHASERRLPLTTSPSGLSLRAEGPGTQSSSASPGLRASLAAHGSTTTSATRSTNA